jgi:hypothetical protein
MVFSPLQNPDKVIENDPFDFKGKIGFYLL